MIEFINTHFLMSSIFTIIMFIGLVSMDNKKKNYDSKLIIFVIVLMNLYNPYSTQQSALENINSFNQGEILICNVNDLKYKVLLLDEWHIVDEYYFNKDSILLRADMCEVQDG